jgi:hypothetical protein
LEDRELIVKPAELNNQAGFIFFENNPGLHKLKTK